MNWYNLFFTNSFQVSYALVWYLSYTVTYSLQSDKLHMD
jgi:hypothetical protein